MDLLRRYIKERNSLLCLNASVGAIVLIIPYQCEEGGELQLTVFEMFFMSACLSGVELTAADDDDAADCRL